MKILQKKIRKISTSENDYKKIHKPAKSTIESRKIDYENFKNEIEKQKIFINQYEKEIKELEEENQTLKKKCNHLENQLIQLVDSKIKKMKNEDEWQELIIDLYKKQKNQEIFLVGLKEEEHNFIGGNNLEKQREKNLNEFKEIKIEISDMEKKIEFVKETINKNNINIIEKKRIISERNEKIFFKNKAIKKIEKKYINIKYDL